MTKRPKITPDLLATIINAVPERLRKKLDREPRAADAWDWSEANGFWSVRAGEETVRIPADVISDVAQVECSCLLSPRCFHVLAVLNVAEIASGEDSPPNVAELDDAAPTSDETIQTTSDQTQHGSDNSVDRPHGDLQPLTLAQRQAARFMFDACAGILATGLRAAGAQLQSRLLRAIHECRSEGLHRAASGGLRLMNSLRLLRDGNDQFSSPTAEADFCDALETCVRLASPQDAVPQSLAGLATSSRIAAEDHDTTGSPEPASASLEWIGISRRAYQPVSSLKLHALFCEPVLTRSGYSGVVTWLMSDDGWIGTISDIQPGDAKRIPQAWQSGVSLAGLSSSHRDLSQKCLLISKATRSIDGRLGGGESARAVAIDGQGWDAPPVAARFQLPMAKQIREVFSRQPTVEFLRPAGTDLVFLTVTIVGYAGQELVVQEAGSGTLLRMSIAIDDDALAFRSSLQTLSRVPGLAIRCIGRIDITSAGRIQLLAVAPALVDCAIAEDSVAGNKPQLVLSGAARVVSIGLTGITRSHLTSAESLPVDVAHLLGGMEEFSSGHHRGDALERWLQAIVVGGRHAIPQGLVTSAVRDAAILKSSLRSAAASLLHALTQSTIATGTELTGIRFSEPPAALATRWLAASVGSRATSQYLQFHNWLMHLESLSAG